MIVPGSEPSPEAVPPPPPALIASPAAPWPSWPGWLGTLVGLIVSLTCIMALAGVAMGQLEVRNRDLLVAGSWAGAAMIGVGLVYQALRQLRARRHLPANRYRGPSLLLLLALVFLIANVAAFPFIDELVLTIGSGGQIGTGEALVLLTSTQAALLLVVGLFVVLPGALPGAPPIHGGRPVASIGAGIWYGAIGFVVANLVAIAWVWLLERIGLPITPQPIEEALAVVNPLVIVFAVVILAPVAEEIFFRGVAYTAWKREYGVRRALIGSAAVFALIHLGLPALLPIFLLGVGLAWLYERTGSLLASIAMHATYNGIGIAFFLVAQYTDVRLPF